MFRFLFLFYCLCTVTAVGAQENRAPVQPITGPGSPELYKHDSVILINAAQKPDGYWLFEPASPRPDSAPVLVFLHGYGAYNPMIYGKWVKHLVHQGWVVIYPRYQRNLQSPRPSKFARNAAKGIREAMLSMQKDPQRVKPKVDQFLMVGHSYGGATATVLCNDVEQYGIPLPSALLLAQPGTGALRTGKLDTYAQLPDSLPIVVIGSADDFTVGIEMPKLIVATGHGAVPRYFLYQVADNVGEPSLTASHLEPYGFDLAFDNGIRNYTARRTLSRSKLDAIDWYLYWAALDILAIDVRSGKVEMEKFPARLPLATWQNGTPARFLLNIHVF